MSLAITIEAGKMIASIPDAKGRLKKYAVETAPPDIDVWRCLVAEQGKRTSYKVRLTKFGEWLCDCPDKYAALREQRDCKHRIAAIQIAAAQGIDMAKQKVAEMAAAQKASTPAEQLRRALRNPFKQEEVKFKPQTVKGGRCMAVAYIDARLVMDRLDAVVGVANWRSSYTPLGDGTVLCKLEIKIDGEWVAKEDLGGESGQPDKGDKRKAAFSDALKRAAIHWGVGRYLYSLGNVWVDYDEQKRRFRNTPPVRLPAWALPGGLDAIDEPPPPEDDEIHEEPEAKVEQKPTMQKPANGTAPTNGASKNAKSLWEHATDRDAQWSAEGLCKRGELLEFLKENLIPILGPEVKKWAGFAHQALIKDKVSEFKQRAEDVRQSA